MINFSNTKDLNNLILLEKSSLNSTLTIQKTLNLQILSFIKSCMGSVSVSIGSSPSDLFIKYINKSSYILNKSNNNILYLKKLIKTLDTISNKVKNSSNVELVNLIENYNSFFNKGMKSVYENTKKIEFFIHKISLIDLSKLISKFNEDNIDLKCNNKTTSLISAFELDKSLVENTLVISELKNKVILPYKFEDIKNILIAEKSSYSSIDEVIDKLYTVPIKNYKFPSISRFKEAYNLVRKKEHKSHFVALSLAFELSVNYNLHPAIITACKNLDELDIYLACLETNSLNDFDYFDIKYEVPPTVFKKAIE